MATRRIVLCVTTPSTLRIKYPHAANMSLSGTPLSIDRINAAGYVASPDERKERHLTILRAIFVELLTLRFPVESMSNDLGSSYDSLIIISSLVYRQSFFSACTPEEVEAVFLHVHVPTVVSNSR